MPDRLCKTRIETNGVAVLSIPGSSAVSLRHLLETFHRQVQGLIANATVKGIVVAGSTTAFCQCTREKTTPAEAMSLSAFSQQVMFDLEKSEKPVIAAISGECSDAGLELALACNFILASDSSSFGFPAIADGMIPLCGGTQRLARLVGKSKAKQMIFSGEMVTAEEALRIRLINHLYPDGELLPQAIDLLVRICRNSPRAIRVGGEVVNAGADVDLQTACLLERNAFALCFSSFDQREGMQAFLEKRPPHFTGE